MLMIERNQFGGRTFESPNDYIANFLEQRDTITDKDLSTKAI